MDGNGRWARARGLPRSAGHQAGVAATRGLVEQCATRGIEVLTIFAFSSENWRRPAREVQLLMELFQRTIKSETARLHEHGVRVRFIGERGRFSRALQGRIASAEELTAGNDGLTLMIAVNYGGRWDLTQAARRLYTDIVAGVRDGAAIDEETLGGYLASAGHPDPDLFIRTGGEQRISNYLLWQLAYTELYFTDVLWPDFDAAALEQALDFFARRQRRFGLTGEQIGNAGERA